MTRTLNGWRRMGLIVIAMWILGTVAFISYEYMNPGLGKGRRVFVNLSLPKGTVLDVDTAVLPGGRTVKLNRREPVTGRILEPWEIDWANQPEMPVSHEFDWGRILLVLFATPAAIWGLVEFAVKVARWIGAGFQSEGK